jgi:hypothetical protein
MWMLMWMVLGRGDYIGHSIRHHGAHHSAFVSIYDMGWVSGTNQLFTCRCVPADMSITDAEPGEACRSRQANSSARQAQQ